MSRDTVTYTFEPSDLPYHWGGASRSQGLIFATKNAIQRGVSIDDLLTVTFSHEAGDESSPEYIDPEDDGTLAKVAEWMRWRVFTLKECIEFAHSASKYRGHAFTRSMHRLQDEYDFSRDEAVVFCRQALMVGRDRSKLQRSYPVFSHTLKLYSIDTHDGLALGANRGIRLLGNKMGIHHDDFPRHALDWLRGQGMDLEVAANWLLFDYDQKYALRAHSAGLSPVDVETQILEHRELLSSDDFRKFGLPTVLERIALRAEGGFVPPMEWVAATM